MTSESTLALPRGLVPADAGLLRWALKLDAVVTGANGIAYLALAGPLSDLFDVPSATLRTLGAFLAVFAVGVWVVATRPASAASDSAAAAGRLAWVVVAANVLWVAASLAAFAADAWSPSTAGAVWTLMQAAVVALFAALQVTGLRRLR
jgi:hypothetical protein